MSTPLKAPFPYTGGKRRVAALVHEKLGSVDTYIEPFAGSLAVLLASPRRAAVEVVGDLDGHITNVWRSIAWAPDDVARWAAWPPSSIDLRARRAWLIDQRAAMTQRLERDPMFFDAKAAGWWLWGKGIWSPPMWPELPSCQRDATMRLHCYGQGVHSLGNRDSLHEVIAALSARMRHVRIAQGEWSSCVRKWVGIESGTRGVLLDPPYHKRTGRHQGLYSVEDMVIADEVAEWARAKGADALWRIVLCGIDGEHDMPGWEKVVWDESSRETIWCSPHCTRQHQQGRML